MKKKGDLDRTASELTKIPPYVVKLVTRAWVEAIQAALVDDGVVQIDSFGTFSIMTQAARQQALPRRQFGKKVVPGNSVDVPIKIRVVFRKGSQLKQVLKQRYDIQGEASVKSKHR